MANPSKHSGFLRLTSALTLVLYLFTQGVCPPGYAYSRPADTKSNQSIESVLKTLPESLGSVSELWGPAQTGTSSSRERDEVIGLRPAQTDKPFVLLVQDAHGQMDAQRNTEQLLKFLDRKIPLNNFFIEGGAGKLEPENLRLFQETSMNLTAAKWFLREGDLGGVELFLLGKSGVTKRQKKTSRLLIWGAEDRDLYLKNLALFEKVAAQSPAIDVWLSRKLLTLEKNASQSLNPELLRFFKAWTLYEKTPNRLESYLAVLEEAAAENAHVTLSDAASQQAWPMLVRYSELKRRQTQLNFEKTLEDAERLCEWAKTKGLGSQPLVRRLKTMLKSTSAFPSSSDLRGQWESFYQSAKPRGFSFDRYPALSLWQGARILESEMDAKQLTLEAISLRDRILDSLALQPEEQRIVEDYRNYLLLEKLLKLRLERPDFEKIVKSHQLLPQRENSPKAVTPATQVFNDAIHFYETAIAREGKMAELLLQSSGKETLKVFVAGGFHTQGVTDRLREAGVPYAVVSPHMSRVEDENRYWNSMISTKPLFAAPVLTPVKLETIHPVSHARIANMLADWQGQLPSMIRIRRERMFQRIYQAGKHAGATLTESSRQYAMARSEVRMQEVNLGGVRWRRYEAGADKPWVLAVEPFDDEAMKDLIGKVNLDWIHPEDEPLTTAKILKAIDESDKPYRFVLGFVNYGFKRELFEKLNARLAVAGLADLPKGLPVMSTGINNIDLAAASEKGFQVTNASGILTQSMLEMNAAALLNGHYRLWSSLTTSPNILPSPASLEGFYYQSSEFTANQAEHDRMTAQILFGQAMRRVGELDRKDSYARSGEWKNTAVGNRAPAHRLLGFDTVVQSQTALGIIGGGEMAKEIFKMAGALGVRSVVLYSQGQLGEHLSRDAERAGITWYKRETKTNVLRRSDVVIRLPGAAKISDQELKGLPASSVLIDPERLEVEPYGRKALYEKSLADKPLGIIGLGSIGESTAEFAAVLGMPLLVHQRGAERAEYLQKKARLDRKLQLNGLPALEYVSIEDLFKRAYAVTLLPSDGPKHMVRRALLESASNLGLFINTGRGFLVDEAALVSTLHARSDLTVVLDVLEGEAQIDSIPIHITPIFSIPHPQTLILGHTGSKEVATRRKMAEVMVKNLLMMIDGKKPSAPKNEVWKNWGARSEVRGEAGQSQKPKIMTLVLGQDQKAEGRLTDLASESVVEPFALRMVPGSNAQKEELLSLDFVLMDALEDWKQNLMNAFNGGNVETVTQDGFGLTVTLKTPAIVAEESPASTVYLQFTGGKNFHIMPNGFRNFVSEVKKRTDVDAIQSFRAGLGSMGMNVYGLPDSDRVDTIAELFSLPREMLLDEKAYAEAEEAYVKALLTKKAAETVTPQPNAALLAVGSVEKTVISEGAVAEVSGTKVMVPTEVTGVGTGTLPDKTPAEVLPVKEETLSLEAAAKADSQVKDTLRKKAAEFFSLSRTTQQVLDSVKVPAGSLLIGKLNRIYFEPFGVAALKVSAKAPQESKPVIESSDTVIPLYFSNTGNFSMEQLQHLLQSQTATGEPQASSTEQLFGTVDPAGLLRVYKLKPLPGQAGLLNDSRGFLQKMDGRTFVQAVNEKIFGGEFNLTKSTIQNAGLRKKQARQWTAWLQQVLTDFSDEIFSAVIIASIRQSFGLQIRKFELLEFADPGNQSNVIAQIQATARRNPATAQSVERQAVRSYNAKSKKFNDDLDAMDKSFRPLVEKAALFASELLSSTIQDEFFEGAQVGQLSASVPALKPQEVQVSETESQQPVAATLAPEKLEAVSAERLQQIKRETSQKKGQWLADDDEVFRRFFLEWAPKQFAQTKKIPNFPETRNAWQEKRKKDLAEKTEADRLAQVAEAERARVQAELEEQQRETELALQRKQTERTDGRTAIEDFIWREVDKNQKQNNLRWTKLGDEDGVREYARTTWISEAMIDQYLGSPETARIYPDSKEFRKAMTAHRTDKSPQALLAGQADDLQTRLKAADGNDLVFVQTLLTETVELLKQSLVKTQQLALEKERRDLLSRMVEKTRLAVAAALNEIVELEKQFSPEEREALRERIFKTFELIPPNDETAYQADLEADLKRLELAFEFLDVLLKLSAFAESGVFDSLESVRVVLLSSAPLQEKLKAGGENSWLESLDGIRVVIADGYAVTLVTAAQAAVEGKEGAEISKLLAAQTLFTQADVVLFADAALLLDAEIKAIQDKLQKRTAAATKTAQQQELGAKVARRQEIEALLKNAKPDAATAAAILAAPELKAELIDRVVLEWLTALSVEKPNAEIPAVLPKTDKLKSFLTSALKKPATADLKRHLFNAVLSMANARSEVRRPKTQLGVSKEPSSNFELRTSNPLRSEVRAKASRDDARKKMKKLEKKTEADEAQAEKMRFAALVIGGALGGGLLFDWIILGMSPLDPEVPLGRFFAVYFLTAASIAILAIVPMSIPFWIAQSRAAKAEWARQVQLWAERAERRKEMAAERARKKEVQTEAARRAAEAQSQLLVPTGKSAVAESVEKPAVIKTALEQALSYGQEVLRTRLSPYGTAARRKTAARNVEALETEFNAAAVGLYQSAIQRFALQAGDQASLRAQIEPAVQRIRAVITSKLTELRTAELKVYTAKRDRETAKLLRSLPSYVEPALQHARGFLAQELNRDFPTDEALRFFEDHVRSETERLLDRLKLTADDIAALEKKIDGIRETLRQALAAEKKIVDDSREAQRQLELAETQRVEAFQNAKTAIENYLWRRIVDGQHTAKFGTEAEVRTFAQSWITDAMVAGYQTNAKIFLEKLRYIDFQKAWDMHAKSQDPKYLQEQRVKAVLTSLNGLTPDRIAETVSAIRAAAALLAAEADLEISQKKRLESAVVKILGLTLSAMAQRLKKELSGQIAISAELKTDFDLTGQLLAETGWSDLQAMQTRVGSLKAQMTEHDLSVELARAVDVELQVLAAASLTDAVVVEEALQESLKLQLNDRLPSESEQAIRAAREELYDRWFQNALNQIQRASAELQTESREPELLPELTLGRRVLALEEFSGRHPELGQVIAEAEGAAAALRWLRSADALAARVSAEDGAAVKTSFEESSDLDLNDVWGGNVMARRETLVKAFAGKLVDLYLEVQEGGELDRASLIQNQLRLVEGALVDDEKPFLKDAYEAVIALQRTAQQRKAADLHQGILNHAKLLAQYLENPVPVQDAAKFFLAEPKFQELINEESTVKKFLEQAAKGNGAKRLDSLQTYLGVDNEGTKVKSSPSDKATGHERRALITALTKIVVAMRSEVRLPNQPFGSELVSPQPERGEVRLPNQPFGSELVSLQPERGEVRGVTPQSIIDLGSKDDEGRFMEETNPRFLSLMGHDAIIQRMRQITQTAEKSISVSPEDSFPGGIYRTASPSRVLHALSQAGYQKGQTVMDLGHGTGEILFTAAVALGAKGMGAEWTSVTFRRSVASREALIHEGLLTEGQVELQEGDFNGLNFGKADYIFYHSSGTSSEHINFPKIIAGMKPGAKLLLLGVQVDEDEESPDGGTRTNYYQDFTPLLASGQFELSRRASPGVWIFTKLAGGRLTAQSKTSERADSHRARLRNEIQEARPVMERFLGEGYTGKLIEAYIARIEKDENLDGFNLAHLAQLRMYASGAEKSVLQLQDDRALEVVFVRAGRPTRYDSNHIYYSLYFLQGKPVAYAIADIGDNEDLETVTAQVGFRLLAEYRESNELGQAVQSSEVFKNALKLFYAAQPDIQEFLLNADHQMSNWVGAERVSLLFYLNAGFYPPEAKELADQVLDLKLSGMRFDLSPESADSKNYLNPLLGMRQQNLWVFPLTMQRSEVRSSVDDVKALVGALHSAKSMDDVYQIALKLGELEQLDFISALRQIEKFPGPPHEGVSTDAQILEHAKKFLDLYHAEFSAEGIPEGQIIQPEFAVPAIREGLLSRFPAERIDQGIGYVRSIFRSEGEVPVVDLSALSTVKAFMEATGMHFKFFGAQEYLSTRPTKSEPEPTVTGSFKRRQFAEKIIKSGFLVPVSSPPLHGDKDRDVDTAVGSVSSPHVSGGDLQAGFPTKAFGNDKSTPVTFYINSSGNAIQGLLHEVQLFVEEGIEIDGVLYKLPEGSKVIMVAHDTLSPAKEKMVREKFPKYSDGVFFLSKFIDEARKLAMYEGEDDAAVKHKLENINTLLSEMDRFVDLWNATYPNEPRMHVRASNEESALVGGASILRNVREKLAVQGIDHVDYIAMGRGGGGPTAGMALEAKYHLDQKGEKTEVWAVGSDIPTVSLADGQAIQNAQSLFQETLQGVPEHLKSANIPEEFFYKAVADIHAYAATTGQPLKIEASAASGLAKLYSIMADPSQWHLLKPNADGREKVYVTVLSGMNYGQYVVDEANRVFNRDQMQGTDYLFAQAVYQNFKARADYDLTLKRLQGGFVRTRHGSSYPSDGDAGIQSDTPEALTAQRLPLAADGLTLASIDYEVRSLNGKLKSPVDADAIRPLVLARLREDAKFKARVEASRVEQTLDQATGESRSEVRADLPAEFKMADLDIRRLNAQMAYRFRPLGLNTEFDDNFQPDNYGIRVWRPEGWRGTAWSGNVQYSGAMLSFVNLDNLDRTLSPHIWIHFSDEFVMFSQTLEDHKEGFTAFLPQETPLKALATDDEGKLYAVVAPSLITAYQEAPVSEFAKPTLEELPIGLIASDDERLASMKIIPLVKPSRSEVRSIEELIAGAAVLAAAVVAVRFGLKKWQEKRERDILKTYPQTAEKLRAKILEDLHQSPGYRNHDFLNLQWTKIPQYQLEMLERFFTENRSFSLTFSHDDRGPLRLMDGVAYHDMLKKIEDLGGSADMQNQFKTTVSFSIGADKAVRSEVRIDTLVSKHADNFRARRSEMRSLPEDWDSLNEPDLFSPEEKIVFDWRMGYLDGLWPNWDVPAKQMLLTPSFLLMLLGAKPGYISTTREEPLPSKFFTVANDRFRDDLGYGLFNDEVRQSPIAFSLRESVQVISENSSYLREQGLQLEDDDTRGLTLLARHPYWNWQDDHVLYARSTLSGLFAQAVKKTSTWDVFMGLIAGYPANDVKEYVQINGRELGHEGVLENFMDYRSTEFANVFFLSRKEGSPEADRQKARFRAALYYAYAGLRHHPDFKTIANQINLPTTVYTSPVPQSLARSEVRTHSPDQLDPKFKRWVSAARLLIRNHGIYILQLTPKSTLNTPERMKAGKLFMELSQVLGRMRILPIPEDGKAGLSADLKKPTVYVHGPEDRGTYSLETVARTLVRAALTYREFKKIPDFEKLAPDAKKAKVSQFALEADMAIAQVRKKIQGIDTDFALLDDLIDEQVLSWLDPDGSFFAELGAQKNVMRAEEKVRYEAEVRSGALQPALPQSMKVYFALLLMDFSEHHDLEKLGQSTSGFELELTEALNTQVMPEQKDPVPEMLAGLINAMSSLIRKEKVSLAEPMQVLMDQNLVHLLAKQVTEAMRIYILSQYWQGEDLFELQRDLSEAFLKIDPSLELYSFLRHDFLLEQIKAGIATADISVDAAEKLQAEMQAGKRGTVSALGAAMANALRLTGEAAATSKALHIGGGQTLRIGGPTGAETYSATEVATVSEASTSQGVVPGSPTASRPTTTRVLDLTKRPALPEHAGYNLSGQILITNMDKLLTGMAESKESVTAEYFTSNYPSDWTANLETAFRRREAGTVTNLEELKNVVLFMMHLYHLETSQGQVVKRKIKVLEAKWATAGNKIGSVFSDAELDRLVAQLGTQHRVGAKKGGVYSKEQIRTASFIALGLISYLTRIQKTDEKEMKMGDQQLAPKARAFYAKALGELAQETGDNFFAYVVANLQVVEQSLKQQKAVTPPASAASAVASSPRTMPLSSDGSAEETPAAAAASKPTKRGLWDVISGGAGRKERGQPASPEEAPKPAQPLYPTEPTFEGFLGRVEKIGKTVRNHVERKSLKEAVTAVKILFGGTEDGFKKGYRAIAGESHPDRADQLLELNKASSAIFEMIDGDKVIQKELLAKLDILLEKAKDYLSSLDGKTRERIAAKSAPSTAAVPGAPAALSGRIETLLEQILAEMQAMTGLQRQEIALLEQFLKAAGAAPVAGLASAAASTVHTKNEKTLGRLLSLRRDLTALREKHETLKNEKTIYEVAVGMTITGTDKAAEFQRILGQIPIWLDSTLTTEAYEQIGKSQESEGVLQDKYDAVSQTLGEAELALPIFKQLIEGLESAWPTATTIAAQMASAKSEVRTAEQGLAYYLELKNLLTGVAPTRNLWGDDMWDNIGIYDHEPYGQQLVSIRLASLESPLNKGQYALALGDYVVASVNPDGAMIEDVDFASLLVAIRAGIAAPDAVRQLVIARERERNEIILVHSRWPVGLYEERRAQLAELGKNNSGIQGIEKNKLSLALFLKTITILYQAFGQEGAVQSLSEIQGRYGSDSIAPLFRGFGTQDKVYLDVAGYQKLGGNHLEFWDNHVLKLIDDEVDPTRVRFMLEPRHPGQLPLTDEYYVFYREMTENGIPVIYDHPDPTRETDRFSRFFLGDYNAKYDPRDWRRYPLFAPSESGARSEMRTDAPSFDELTEALWQMRGHDLTLKTITAVQFKGPVEVMRLLTEIMGQYPNVFNFSVDEKAKFTGMVERLNSKDGDRFKDELNGRMGLEFHSWQEILATLYVAYFARAKQAPEKIGGLSAGRFFHQLDQEVPGKELSRSVLRTTPEYSIEAVVWEHTGVQIELSYETPAIPFKRKAGQGSLVRVDILKTDVGQAKQERIAFIIGNVAPNSLDTLSDVVTGVEPSWREHGLARDAYKQLGLILGPRIQRMESEIGNEKTISQLMERLRGFTDAGHVTKIDTFMQGDLKAKADYVKIFLAQHNDQVEWLNDTVFPANFLKTTVLGKLRTAAGFDKLQIAVRGEERGNIFYVEQIILTGERADARSEVRYVNASLLAVARSMTAKIVRISDLRPEILAKLFPSVLQQPEAKLPEAERQWILRFYTALFKQGSSIILPADLLRQVSTEAQRDFIQLLIEALQNAKVNPREPLINIADDQNNELKNLFFAPQNWRANSVVGVDASRAVKFWREAESFVATRLEKQKTRFAAAILSASFSSPVERGRLGGGMSKTMLSRSFLVDPSDVRKLTRVQRVIFQARLTQLLQAASALNEEEFAQLSRELGLNYQIGEAIALAPSAILSSVFAERMNAVLIAKSA